MTSRQIELIKDSWSRVRSMDTVIIGDSFYSKLFVEAPQVQPLFKSDRLEQANKLIAILTVVVNHLEKLDELNNAIRQLALRHVKYGVIPEHYAIVGKTLLWTLQKHLGNYWNDELAEAWGECYNTLASNMISVAYEPADVVVMKNYS